MATSRCALLKIVWSSENSISRRWSIRYTFISPVISFSPFSIARRNSNDNIQKRVDRRHVSTRVHVHFHEIITQMARAIDRSRSGYTVLIKLEFFFRWRRSFRVESIHLVYWNIRIYGTRYSLVFLRTI